VRATIARFADELVQPPCPGALRLAMAGGKRVTPRRPTDRRSCPVPSGSPAASRAVRTRTCQMGILRRRAAGRRHRNGGRVAWL